MKTTNETMLELYQILGAIFYECAKTDRFIHPDEISVLKKMVKEEWTNVDQTQDAFDSDSAYQIEIVFDYMYENDVENEDVLFQLKEFKRIQNHLFSPELNHLIFKTANQIASSFAQRNKSELVFLSQLQQILLQ
jgi:hypothetical protein